jgi:hypothetical protein
MCMAKDSIRMSMSSAVDGVASDLQAKENGSLIDLKVLEGSVTSRHTGGALDQR